MKKIYKMLGIGQLVLFAATSAMGSDKTSWDNLFKSDQGNWFEQSQQRMSEMQKNFSRVQQQQQQKMAEMQQKMADEQQLLNQQRVGPDFEPVIHMNPGSYIRCFSENKVNGRVVESTLLEKKFDTIEDIINFQKEHQK